MKPAPAGLASCVHGGNSMYQHETTPIAATCPTCQHDLALRDGQFICDRDTCNERGTFFLYGRVLVRTADAERAARAALPWETEA